MIVLFTSNNSGGVIQFVMQLVHSFTNLNIDVIALVPNGSRYSVEQTLESKVNFYEKKKSIRSLSKDANTISDQITKYNPILVWFIDDSILSMKVLITLTDKVQTFLTIHDVNQHLYQFNLRRSVVGSIKNVIRPEAISKATKILLLSENSHSHFESKYPRYINKTVVFKLGAHIPIVSPQSTEIDSKYERGYYLFFGRIDKYKGISNLLKAYLAISKDINI